MTLTGDYDNRHNLFIQHYSHSWQVLRKCRKSLCEQVRFSSSDADQINKLEQLQLQLHSSAYNCLVALFVRTQTEPKLYLACLFKDDVAKGEFVFEPLIDRKREYTFSVEVDSLRERRTRVISLRGEFREDGPVSGLETASSLAGLLSTTDTLIGNALNAAEMVNGALFN